MNLKNTQSQCQLEFAIQILILKSGLKPDESLEVIEQLRHDLKYGVGENTEN